jgi:hypothetical protein
MHMQLPSDAVAASATIMSMHASSAHSLNCTQVYCRTYTYEMIITGLLVQTKASRKCKPACRVTKLAVFVPVMCMSSSIHGELMLPAGELMLPAGELMPTCW